MDTKNRSEYDTHPLPVVPRNACDVVPHESAGTFLGWTFRNRTRLPRLHAYGYIRPDQSISIRPSLSFLDALNHLRGPAGLPALVND